jgi:hypothetical protein
MTITLTREEAQQVLDALECMNEGAFNAEIKLLRARLSAPEPEPVAWMHSLTGGGWQVVPEKLYPTDQPLYTAPPQRERVQFPTMLRKMWSGSEVQAWLDENLNKEKNHG